MERNSIRWRLPASYAVIALLAALSLGSVMLLVLRGYYVGQERDYLFGNAIALRPVIEQILQSDLPEDFVQPAGFELQRLYVPVVLVDQPGHIMPGRHVFAAAARDSDECAVLAVRFGRRHDG